MPDLVLKWAWRYHILEVDTYESLDDAARSAVWASNAGEESVSAVEVFRADGTHEVFDQEALAGLMRPIQDAEDKEYEARPNPTVTLRLKSPDGRWSIYGGYVEREKGEQEAEMFRKALGADRVKLEPWGRR